MVRLAGSKIRDSKVRKKQFGILKAKKELLTHHECIKRYTEWNHY